MDLINWIGLVKNSAMTKGDDDLFSNFEKPPSLIVTIMLQRFSHKVQTSSGKKGGQFTRRLDRHQEWTSF